MTTPERTCVGCRRRAPKPGLLRLAWDSGAAAVVVDRRQVLPGRGCYVHAECAARAARRGVVGRALRRPANADQVDAVLAAVTAAELA